MSLPDNDMYEILGLEPGTSWDEIKTAYRRLAKKHHPDRNPGDAASEYWFKQVNHAYEGLREMHEVQDDVEAQGPSRRRPERGYDRHRHEPQARERWKDEEQAPRDGPRGEEQSQTEQVSTESKPLRSLGPGWRWRAEDVDWERFRRNPPEWYLAHRRDLDRPRQPHMIWRMLRTAGLALAYAYFGVGLLFVIVAILDVLLSSFGIYLF